MARQFLFSSSYFVPFLFTRVGFMAGWQNYPSFSADPTVARSIYSVVRPELKFIAFIALQQRQRGTAGHIKRRATKRTLAREVSSIAGLSFFLIR